MSRTWVSTAALLLLIACDGSSPAPTAPTALTRPTAPLASATLSGVVRAGGAPVPGARVSVLTDYRAAADSILTDEAGRYHFPAVVNSDASGALVSVARHGYLIETAYVLVPQAERVFDLEPAEHIQVGQIVRSAVLDDRCASFGYGGGNGSLCRRFAVTPESSGTLQITASGAGAPFDLAVLNQQGTITAYTTSSQLSLPVSAGLTYQIDVVPIGGREFELTPSLH